MQAAEGEERLLCQQWARMCCQVLTPPTSGHGRNTTNYDVSMQALGVQHVMPLLLRRPMKHLGAYFLMRFHPIYMKFRTAY